MADELGTMYTYLIDVRNVQGDVCDLLDEVEGEYEYPDDTNYKSFIAGYDDENGKNHAFMTFNFFEDEGKEDPIELVARIFNIELKDFQVRIVKRG